MKKEKQTQEDFIKILESFNMWRMGADIPMPNPKEVTHAINQSLKFLKKQRLKPPKKS